MELQKAEKKRIELKKRKLKKGMKLKKTKKETMELKKENKTEKGTDLKYHIEVRNGIYL